MFKGASLVKQSKSEFNMMNNILQILLSPPLRRCQPYWYAANFNTIVSSFAKVFEKSPARLTLLPPFDCSPESFSADGIHFTPGEGER
jgi:hypothetical protein